MDIFDILKEAKDPDSTEVKIDATEVDDSSDYESEVEDTEDETPDDTEDDSETEEEPADDAEDAAVEEEPEEDEADTESEPTDYTAEIEDADSENETEDTGSSDSVDDQQEEVTPEEASENKKNAALMKNTIALYYSIDGTLDRLDDLTFMDVLSNKIIIQVKQNLSELREMVFDFVINKFQHGTYVKNLYIYNYFIESYKISVTMLAEIDSNE